MLCGFLFAVYPLTQVRVLYDLRALRKWMQAQMDVLATTPDPHCAAADTAVAQLKRWRAIKGGRK